MQASDSPATKGVASDLVVLGYGSELYTKNTGSGQSPTLVHPTENQKRTVSHKLIKFFQGEKILTQSLERFTGYKQNVQSWPCHFWATGVFFGRHAFDLVIFCGRNTRLVSTTSTRAMSAARYARVPRHRGCG